MSLVRTNLAELDLGLKGDLTMSEAMENLAKQLAEGGALYNLASSETPICYTVLFYMVQM